jgi:uncharacterized spore protein YtfJ
MTTTVDGVDATLDQSRAVTEAMMTKIFAAAQPGAVFSAPVIAGAYTVITASEVGAGGGFGSGRGTGMKPTDRSSTNGSLVQGEGGGTGGGGGANGRPIAAIVIGPDGVTVQPIFDVTKIMLSLITAWGVMLAAYWRMRTKTR